jgi:hypothetical protein
MPNSTYVVSIADERLHFCCIIRSHALVSLFKGVITRLSYREGSGADP